MIQAELVLEYVPFADELAALETDEDTNDTANSTDDADDICFLLSVHGF